MQQVPHKVLTDCFTKKLPGAVARDTEHTHYEFEVDGKVVATTHLSPRKKIKDIGDNLLGRIAREMGIRTSVLRDSANCSAPATAAILEAWRNQT